MAKQVFQEVVPGDEAWDAQLETNRQIMLTAIPLPNYADIASLPAAAANDDAVAVADVNDDTDYTGKVVVVSVASAWKKLAYQVAEVTALVDSSGGTANGTIAVIPDPADTPVDADALRDDLVTNVLPTIRDAIADLAAKIEELLTAMKDAGNMQSV